jgi:hypothetical protein
VAAATGTEAGVVNEVISAGSAGTAALITEMNSVDEEDLEDSMEDAGFEIPFSCVFALNAYCT